MSSQHRSTAATAPLIEVYPSFQGEGPRAGEAMLFVRVAVCPLRCTYCDTAYSYRAGEQFALRHWNGDSHGERSNPARASTLLDELPARLTEGVGWLALTGGEPLLYPEFARVLFERARHHGLRTLLETAALDAEALSRVLPVTDHAALDFKLASGLTRDDDAETRVAGHVACVRAAAAAGTETAVKIVLTAGVGDGEWRDALSRLQPFRAAVTLVVQPVTPALLERRPAPPPLIALRARQAMAAGFRVLLLPQLHKQVGLL